MKHHAAGPQCPLCDEKLVQAHPAIAAWFRNVKTRFINAHISWAYRNAHDQNEFFRLKKTLVQYPNSKHNRTLNGLPCSAALDLFLLDEDGNDRYPPMFYAKVNSDNEREKLPIRWGGTFKSIGDATHFELKES